MKITLIVKLPCSREGLVLTRTRLPGYFNPGQQAWVANQHILLKKSNTQQEVAWKNGMLDYREFTDGHIEIQGVYSVGSDLQSRHIRTLTLAEAEKVRIEHGLL